MAGKNCEYLEPLNPRSERHHDNAPREDGGDGYRRIARRPRIMGAEMMSEKGATELEGWMKDVVPVHFIGDDY